MKRAIFVLALCVFQTVFADGLFEEELKNLQARSMKQMDGIVKKFEIDLKAALEDAWRNGLNNAVNGCWDDFTTLKAYHEASKSRYEECYNKAVQKTDIKIAEECFGENIAALESEEKKHRSHAKLIIELNYNVKVPPSYRYARIPHIPL